MLQTLASDWRARFAQPDLPFGVVLLAAWRSDSDLTSFPLARLAQTNLTATTPNTFLVNSLDQGDPAKGGVHSPYKREVGRRAALGIQALSLGEAARYLGPRYASASADPAGSAGIVSIRFLGNSVYDGLVVKSNISCPANFNASCEEFAVLSAPDCVWRPANAAMSEADYSIDLHPQSWADGLRPVATRGYFANWPLVTILNTEGIPAEPWREYIVTTEEQCPLDSPALADAAFQLIV
jgi:hypothetical protein